MEKSKKKKIITAISVIAVVVIAFTVAVVLLTRGKCGENLKWSLNLKGTLTVSGTGEMECKGDLWFKKEAPWELVKPLIRNVDIEDGVTLIDRRAFSNCKKLKNVTLPESVTIIDWQAFAGCTNLTRITLPKGVETIWFCAFLDCTGLTDIAIPDSVTEIGPWAFKGCKRLTNITIPKNVTKIYSLAFSGCTSLVNINVSEANEFYSSIDGVVYSKDKKTLFVIPDGRTEYTVPETVTKIDTDLEDGTLLQAMAAFSIMIDDKDYKELTDITIPDSVTEIAAGAFIGYKDLTIHGKQGSYAEQYAKENDIKFVIAKQ